MGRATSELTAHTEQMQHNRTAGMRVAHSGKKTDSGLGWPMAELQDRDAKVWRQGLAQCGSVCGAMWQGLWSNVAAFVEQCGRGCGAPLRELL